MFDGNAILSYPCSVCGSMRAVMPLRLTPESVVNCFDCHEVLGTPENIRRELADKARQHASKLAKRIYEER